jgi:hypothetical protein|tara:strand:- start:11389 stop:11601 length:213 start_codon:yes stop_codon:yes gene_type:complete
MKNRLEEFQKGKMKVRVRTVDHLQKIQSYYGIISELDKNNLILLMDNIVSKHFEMADILDVELEYTSKEI